MNPEEFANLVQLYELNRAQQALNKQINQDQNLSGNNRMRRNFNFNETINSVFFKKFYQFNFNSYFTDFLEKNNNNFFKFLFNSKPIASSVVSSSTSGSTSTLISTNRDLLHSIETQNENLDQVLDTNSSDQVQPRAMLKRKFAENNKYEDQFDKKKVKKSCQKHNRTDEPTDFQIFPTNSLKSNSVDNINIESHIQNYDDEMDSNNDTKIDHEIHANSLQKNRFEHNNNEKNLDLQQKSLLEFAGNFSNELLSKCSLDLFSPILLPTQSQKSDEKLIQDEILKNIKNYDSYLDCNGDQCQSRKFRDHFHCNYEPCVEKSLTKRDEIIRHIKWHKKRLESLNQGFLRFSSTDDCTQFKMQQQQSLSKNITGNCKESIWSPECLHNRKQTHYHCIQPNCDKIYISTSDVQMHSNYHRKDIQLSLDGFQRFRANEKCNKDYCLFNKQQTTHFHCLRENCKFTFKNKSDVEKHKTYHNRDFELLKDGFKKFLKSDQCIYNKCRFSKVCNHIHCMRQDCNYVLHSSGQLLSHKRRHDRLDAENGYHHHHNMLQHLPIGNKHQNDLNLKDSTGLAEFPIDLSLINFSNIDESISGSQASINSTHRNLSSNLKLKTNINNINLKYCTEKPDSNTDLISKDNKSKFSEKLKVFEQFSITNEDLPNFTNNDDLTKNLDNDKNLLCSSMLNSLFLNNANRTIENNVRNNLHKLKSNFENNTNLQSLDKTEIDLMINKYFTINYLKKVIKNKHSNQINDVECTFELPTAKDDGDHENSNDKDSTALKSKQNSLVSISNQKYFHCKIINCNKIIRENLSEILNHMKFHEQQADESCKFLSSESSEDLINLSLTADSLTNENNILLSQNENLMETIPGAEHSMQITSIDGLFNRKRGRPPKNRFVEVYLNNEKHQSPQAVFTSFKLAKHKEKSSLEANSDQFKYFNLISKKRNVFNRNEEEISLKATSTKKSYDVTDEANKKNNVTTDITDDHFILKTLKSKLNNDTIIPGFEEEVSTTNPDIELKNPEDNFVLEQRSNLVLENDENFRTEEKIVRTVKTFYPQNSITINSQETSKHSSPNYLKQNTKKKIKLKKKINNTCILALEDIEESRPDICLHSISNTTESSSYPSVNKLKSIVGPTFNEWNTQNQINEQPEDLSLNRETDEKQSDATQNLPPEYFPPLLQNIQLAQKLALLQQHILPYLAAQKAIKENDSSIEFFKSQFEQHCLIAMTTAINEAVNPNPASNRNSNILDVFPDLQQTSNTNNLEIDKNRASTEVKKKSKYQVILPENVSDQTINEFCNLKALKEEVIPAGYLKFRFNEDCQFSNCSYRNHQTHFHCARIDCYYSFCDKTRFVQHTARHERLDKLMGDDFKQYRANMKCCYKDCEHYKNNTNQIKKSSHFHCLKCNFICSDTNKVVAHRRQHNKTELIELAGFRKISNNEKCYIKFQQNEFNLQNKNELSNVVREEECLYSLKQTHYHCAVCDSAVLSKVQFNAHKHKNVSSNSDLASPNLDITSPNEKPN